MIIRRYYPLFVIIAALTGLIVASFATTSAIAAGKGSIKGRIVLPESTGQSSPMSVTLQPAGKTPLEGGDGGGGDGGGGGCGGDGGYWGGGWLNIPGLTFPVIEQKTYIQAADLDPGAYNLIFQYGAEQNDEYQMALKNIRVLEGQVTDLKDLLMKKGGNIIGYVKYTGRTDIPPTTVHVVGFIGAPDPANPDSALGNAPPWLQSRAITMTDAAGKFTLTNLAEGTYTLAITPGGDASTTYAREIIANVRVQAEDTISATPFGPLALTPTIGRLNGSVLLSDQTVAHGGTIVRATSEGGYYRSYIQTTDESGAFDFGYIPEGTYSLHIQHAGYKVVERTGRAVPRNTTTTVNEELYPGTFNICGHISLSDGGVVPGDLNNDQHVDLADLVLALRTSAALPVAVSKTGDVDGDGRIGLSSALYDLQVIAGLRSVQSPLAGALVLVPGTPLLAVTDAEGKFNIAKVPRKPDNSLGYDLFITKTGYKANDIIPVTAAASCDYAAVSVALVRNDPVQTGGTVMKGSIIGRAWLKNDPHPESIDISIEGTSHTAKPNLSGNYAFEANIAPGAYKLIYSAAGYKTIVEAGVLVAPDQATEVRNVVLIPRTGTITGKVYLEDAGAVGGKIPGAGVPVKVLPVEAGITADDTGTDGSFSINSVQENFDPVTNRACIINKATGGCVVKVDETSGSCIIDPETGQCDVVKAFTVVIGQDWAQADYRKEEILNQNVPAGETVSLGDILLKKYPPPPTAVTSAQANGSSIRITWTAVAYSAAGDVAGYNVYYGTASNAISVKANTAGLITVPAGGQGQFDVAGLAKGTTYYFAVETVDQDGLVSRTMAPTDGSCTGTLVPDWAGTVMAGSYPLGSMPFDIALTADGAKGYVSSQANASLLKIDFTASPPATTAQIVIPGTYPQPSALAFNPSRNELYVVDEYNGKLFAVNTATDAIDATPVVSVSAPRNVIVSPDGGKIYLCSRYGTADKITIIDAATRTVDAEVPLGDVDPYGMAIAKNKLYVAGTYSTQVKVIDLGTRNVASIPVGTGAPAYDAIARADGQGDYVYISHSTVDGEISVINTATGTLEKVITLKNAGDTNPQKNPRGMAISGNILYVANWGDNTLAMINTDTNEKLNLPSYLLSGGTRPENLVVTPDGQKLYIVHSGSASVEILGY